MDSFNVGDPVKNCEGCGRELSPAEGLYWSVCMDCTKARHKAALAHKCRCGSKKRENPEIHRVGSRTWRTCDRCLASTGNLS